MAKFLKCFTSKKQRTTFFVGQSEYVLNYRPFLFCYKTKFG
jgi:hypothetical protein